MYNGIVLFVVHLGYQLIRTTIWHYLQHRFFVHPQNVPSKHRVYHLMHPLLSPNRPLEQVAQEFLQSFLPSAEHFLRKSFLFPQHQVMRDNLSMSERHSQQHQKLR